MSTDPFPRLRLRLHLSASAMLGPGRAELLEHIRATGSIAAAGRAMGMSYKRAWSLAEILNASFRTPLIESARGGSGGGGAHLTPLGEEVLARYRAIEAETLRANAGHLGWLEAQLAPIPSADDISYQK